jgi:hypothetical protein
MCLTVNRYNESIYLLENNIYPKINMLFSNLKNESEHSLEDDVLKDLLKEFSSLEQFERKLIFPSVISTFKQISSSNFAPNIQEIIHLTQSKEEKIKQLVLLLEQCIDQNECATCYSNKPNISSIITVIKNEYFPLKAKWISLLQDLKPEKVNCKNRESGKCKCAKGDTVKIEQFSDTK